MLKRNIHSDFFEDEVELHHAKYENSLSKLRRPSKKHLYSAVFHKRLEKRGYNYIDEMVKPVIDDIEERKKADQGEVTQTKLRKFLNKVCIQVRLQEVQVQIFENASHVLVSGREMPSLIITLG